MKSHNVRDRSIRSHLFRNTECFKDEPDGNAEPRFTPENLI